MKKIILVLLLLFMLAALLASCGNSTPTTSGAGTTETTAAITTKDPNAAKYEEAFALIKQGDSAAAYRIFEELGDYRDAKEQLSYFRYVPTKVLTKNQVYGNTTNIEYLYNEKNLPVKLTKTIDTHTTVYDYKYDDSGNLTETNHVDNYRIVYTYDENQRVSKMTVFYQGTPSYIDLTYDAKGNLLKKVTDSGSAQIYVYDTNGNLTKSYFTGTDTVDTLVSEYFYDSDGYLIKETFAMTEGSVDTVIEYSYNASGDLIQTVYDRDTEDQLILDYTYDADRRLLKEVYSSANSTIISDYIYDESGNLIKISTTDSGMVTTTQSFEYKFVYFPYTVSEQIESIIDVSQHIQ